MKASISIYVIIIIFIQFNLLASTPQGFDPVIRLPRSGSTRTRSKSRRVLSIIDFGAKGDGFHNETQVLSLSSQCFIIELRFIAYRMFRAFDNFVSFRDNHLVFDNLSQRDR